MTNFDTNWKNLPFEDPRYTKCEISVSDLDNGGIVSNWGFLISPNGFSIQMNNETQNNKTMAGYVITRNGPGLASMSLTGVFIDSYYVPERLRFMDFYEKYLVPSQNSFLEFIDVYKQKITIEGYEYEGIVQSISMNKSSNQKYLYQYNLNFTVYKKSKIYNTDSDIRISESEMKEDMGILGTSGYSNTVSKTSVSSISGGVADILFSK